MPKLEFNLEIVSWDKGQTALREIRKTVFIKEQRVPVELEWDEFDQNCQHILATTNGKAIGTGRLTEDGHIGRMAVLKNFRKQGVGSAMLTELIKLARQKKMQTVVLNAQVSAELFYKKFAFETISGVFDDAGIPHVKMQKLL
jgi:predicted GNAT family N-acyltransferase